MMFLLGRQAMFGHEPPTYLRSITTTRCPFWAEVQAISFPPAPLPRTTRSYSSGWVVDVFIILILGSSRLETDRQRQQGAEVEMLAIFQRIRGELEPGQSLHQRTEAGLRQQSSQRRAEAVVDAVAKGQLP